VSASSLSPAVLDEEPIRDADLWFEAVRMIVRAAVDPHIGPARDGAAQYLIGRGLVDAEELATLTAPQIEGRVRQRVVARAPRVVRRRR
jgi:hypothetical protein